jgi:ectoine hydroxylase-related dioxygenase (phytanoyl-CoA dioxygenase family)
MNQEYLERYRRDGVAVIRNVFGDDDVSALKTAFEAVQAEGMRLRASYRHQNVLFRLSQDANLGKTLRLVQWPSYFNDVLNRCRLDRRMLDIVEPLIGDDVKQVINQMHWKPPGAAQSSFGYHQDIWFRRPRHAYRNPASAFVQSGIAIDPQSAANGAMTFCPGSHLLGELSIDDHGRVMDRDMKTADLAQFGLSEEATITLDMNPGDVAIWSLYTVHGSGINRSTGDRRFYLNGYVSAADCDRGEWTFREGKPSTLGDPALVHYDDLYRHPDPHYIDEH